MIERELIRMQHPVMRLIRRFVSQQIAFGSGIKELLIALLLALAYRKRDGAVRMPFLYGADYRYDEFVRVIRVLTALQYKGAETELVAHVAARKDQIFAEAIALGIRVATSDAAVIAIVFAIISEFYQAAEVNLLTVVLFPDSPCLSGQIFIKARSIEKQDSFEFIIRQVPFRFEFISKLKWICSLKRFLHRSGSPIYIMYFRRVSAPHQNLLHHCFCKGYHNLYTYSTRIDLIRTFSFWSRSKVI